MGNLLAVLDDGDRTEFFSDLRAATDLAEGTGDVGHVEKCLSDWRTTAQALSDPVRREVLTAESFDLGDFTEVKQP